MESMANFPDNWITLGWSRGPDGKWIELGAAGVTSEPPPNKPTIGVHDIAALLNAWYPEENERAIAHF